MPRLQGFFRLALSSSNYGLPRLLDWTESPLVAIYFAVERPDDDGCIWGLWPSALNATRDGSYGLVQIKDPRVVKIAESAFNGGIDRKNGHESDPRMLAQMSRFTLHSDPDPLEFMLSSPEWLRRYIIPKDAKAKISKQLSAFGIRRSGVPASASHCARALPPA
jgi:FRG domain